MTDIYNFAEESTGLRLDALLLACAVGSYAWHLLFVVVAKLSNVGF